MYPCDNVIELTNFGKGQFCAGVQSTPQIIISAYCLIFVNIKRMLKIKYLSCDCEGSEQDYVVCTVVINFETGT